jgi:hypothetical protein
MVATDVAELNRGTGDGSWQNRPTPTALPALGTDTIQISGAHLRPPVHARLLACLRAVQ